MSSKTLRTLVRAAIIAVGLCGLAGAGLIIPSLGRDFIRSIPGYSYMFWPWMIFIWLLAVPCFAALVYVWKVSTAIGQEEVFSMKTAKWVSRSALLIFADVGLLFAGNAVFALLNMSHFSIILFSLIISIISMAIGALTAILARYITKAAALQEEADGTI